MVRPSIGLEIEIRLGLALLLEDDLRFRPLTEIEPQKWSLEAIFYV